MDKSNLQAIRAAFTLIEIMVVIGILLASIGFGAARYGDYTNRRRLRDEAKKIMTVMSQASSRAVAGDSSATCADFQGFQVAITTSGSYTVRRCCEGACNSVQSAVQNTQQLPAGLTFSTPATNTTYLFNKLIQGATISPSANQTITVRSTVLARCIPISVSPAGLVTQLPEVSC